MWQQRHTDLVNIANAPAETEAPGPTVLQTWAESTEHQSRALKLSVYKYASSIKSSLPAEAETVKHWVQSLRDWAKTQVFLPDQAQSS